MNMDVMIQLEFVQNIKKGTDKAKMVGLSVFMEKIVIQPLRELGTVINILSFMKNGKLTKKLVYYIIQKKSR